MRSGPATVWPGSYLTTMLCLGLLGFIMKFILVSISQPTDSDYENETWVKWRLRCGLSFTFCFLGFFPVAEAFHSLGTPVSPCVWWSCSEWFWSSHLLFYDFLKVPLPTVKAQICGRYSWFNQVLVYCWCIIRWFLSLKNWFKPSGGFKNQNWWKYVVFLCKN